MLNSFCPVHNLPWKTIPAGISKKTGKPYNSFQTCPTPGCDQRPQELSESAPAPTFVPDAPITETKDEGAIWRAKDRMSMAQTALKTATETYSAEVQINNKPEGSVIRDIETLREEFYTWLEKKANFPND